MMLLIALSVWVILIVFFVALCRGAASADGRDLVPAKGYPSLSQATPPTDLAGLVLFEDRPVPLAAADLRTRARAGRGRVGRSVAGS
jgi:hypothetical protein